MPSLPASDVPGLTCHLDRSNRSTPRREGRFIGARTLLEPMEESRTCLAGSDQVPALIGRRPRPEIPSSEYPLHFLQATDRAPAIRRGDSSVTAHASWIGMRNAARPDCGQLFRQVADSFGSARRDVHGTRVLSHGGHGQTPLRRQPVQ